MDKKVEELGTTRLQYTSGLYKFVDSFNRTLRERDLMFGLAPKEIAVFTIYRT